MAETQKTPQENAQEVFQLVKSYAMQETAIPLQGLGQYLKFGVPGAVLLGMGLFFGLLAILRGMQTIDLFNGHGDGAGWFVWAPYGVAFLVAAIVIALLAKRITKGLEA